MARKWLTGDVELEATLKALGNDKAADRVARSALGAALTATRNAIAKDAPVGPTGNLKRSIGKRFEKGKKTKYRVVSKAGVNVGKNKKDGTNKRAPHGHLVALGTEDRTHKSGKSVGRMTPNPFVRTAVQASLGAVREKMRTQAAKALERERLKALKKR